MILKSGSLISKIEIRFLNFKSVSAHFSFSSKYA